MQATLKREKIISKEKTNYMEVLGGKQSNLQSNVYKSYSVW